LTKVTVRNPAGAADSAVDVAGSAAVAVAVAVFAADAAFAVVLAGDGEDDADRVGDGDAVNTICRLDAVGVTEVSDDDAAAGPWLHGCQTIVTTTSTATSAVNAPAVELAVHLLDRCLRIARSAIRIREIRIRDSRRVPLPRGDAPAGPGLRKNP
jgi:hypothetical protein